MSGNGKVIAPVVLGSSSTVAMNPLTISIPTFPGSGSSASGGGKVWMAIAARRFLHLGRPRFMAAQNWNLKSATQ